MPADRTSPAGRARGWEGREKSRAMGRRFSVFLSSRDEKPGDPKTMLFPPSPRELLIALNAAPRISRPAVCRLAQELPRWSEAPEPPVLLAAAVGIPKAQM